MWNQYFVDENQKYQMYSQKQMILNFLGTKILMNAY